MAASVGGEVVLCAGQDFAVDLGVVLWEEEYAPEICEEAFASRLVGAGRLGVEREGRGMEGKRGVREQCSMALDGLSVDKQAVILWS